MRTSYLRSRRLVPTLTLFLHVYLIVLTITSPSVAHVNNTKQVGRFSNFPDTYGGRVARGEYLRDLMSLDSAAATRRNDGIDVASKFQDLTEVERWGWDRHEKWYPFAAFGIMRPLYGRSVETAFLDEEHPVDKRQAGVLCWLHNNNFMYEDGTDGKATDARFCNVMIPRSDAIAFSENISPLKVVEAGGTGNVPELGRLSDISFLQWLDACEKQHTDPRNLKLIFRAHITYLPTFQHIQEVLKEAGYTEVPGWKNPARVNINTRMGAAILGSNHGASVAWFLIQHKETLGVKKISGVVVWGAHYQFRVSIREGFPFGMDVDSIRRPTLNIRFTIEDVQ